MKHVARSGIALLATCLSLTLAACAFDSSGDGQSAASSQSDTANPKASPDESAATSQSPGSHAQKQARAVGSEPSPSPWNNPGNNPAEPSPSPWNSGINGGSGGSGGDTNKSENHYHPSAALSLPVPPPVN